MHLSSAFDEMDQIIFSDPGISFILVPVPVGAESSQQGDGWHSFVFMGVGMKGSRRRGE